MGQRERLNAYLRSYAGGFKWGERDCYTFTNGAWLAMYGHEWADEWAGAYLSGKTPHGRNELRRRFGFRSLHAAIDTKLTRITGVPPLGALVTIKTPSIVRHAMGISYGIRAAFLSADGVHYAPIDQITGAWIER